MSSSVVVLVAVLCVLAFLGSCLSVYRSLSRRALFPATTRSDAERETESREKKRAAFGDARLPAYVRGDIVIPEWSDDTRECDNFDEAKECLLSDGDFACFECIESRYSSRVCAHVDKPVTLYDEIYRRELTLWPNASNLTGYCLRENLSRQLRVLSNADDADDDGEIRRARRECSVRNADWVLVRKRATANAHDSSFNFVCRCKYPHLMTNHSGPMSACSRDVGCNEHGHLDEDSRASRIDPFVDGRCVCDPGWVPRYNAETTGPHCGEATVGEWPSMIFGRNSATGRAIELHSEYVDDAFRAVLTRNRMDGDEEVVLRDPCHPCPVTRTDDGKAYFCGDSFELEREALRPVVKKAHIGVRRDRDFLSGNGGQYPNACATLASDDGGALPDRILVQFMSQEWSKDKFAMEIGVLTRYPQNLVASSFDYSENYNRFVRVLREPDETSAFADNTSHQCGVVWTFAHRNVSKHRTEVCDRFGKFIRIEEGSIKYTNLSYFGRLRTPFPFYQWSLLGNNFYYFPTGTFVNDVPWLTHHERKYLKPQAYNCPDQRGLDHGYVTLYRTVRTYERTANDMARALLPVCFVYQDDGRGGKYLRPDINRNQNNPTGCVMFYNDDTVSYHGQLWYPGDMSMLQYCDERSSG